MLKFGEPGEEILSFDAGADVLHSRSSGKRLFSVDRSKDGKPIALREAASGFTYCYDHGPHDDKGPGRRRWQRYEGEYHKVQWGRVIESIQIVMRDGHLYAGDRRLSERRRGLFFDCQGHSYDFRNSPVR